MYQGTASSRALEFLHFGETLPFSETLVLVGQAVSPANCLDCMSSRGFRPRHSARYEVRRPASAFMSCTYRTSTLHMPGSNVALRLVEFKGVDRKPLQQKITDPNSLVLRMRVQGIDALAAKLKAAGTRIVSVSGEPYTNGRTRWFMVEGPDNVFVQLTEAPPGAPNPGAPPLPR